VIDVAGRIRALDLTGIRNDADAIVDGGLDLAVGEASQVSVTLLDPEGELIRAKGARMGAVLRWGGLRFTVTVVEHGPMRGARCTAVTARSEGWTALKRRRGARTWRGVSPSAVVAMEAKAVGLEAVCQPSANRKTISRLAQGEKRGSTSTIELIDRLAGELGYVYGEVGGTLFFGAPSWLVKRPGWEVPVDAEWLTEYPMMRRTQDDKKTPATVSLRITGEKPGNVLLPFTPVQLTKAPGGFSGRYLVERVLVPFTATPGDVELATPVDPEAQKPPRGES
jgi:Phage late control gene D protein (GPD).